MCAHTHKHLSACRAAGRGGQAGALRLDDSCTSQGTAAPPGCALLLRMPPARPLQPSPYAQASRQQARARAPRAPCAPADLSSHCTARPRRVSRDAPSSDCNAVLAAPHRHYHAPGHLARPSAREAQRAPRGQPAMAHAQECHVCSPLVTACPLQPTPPRPAPAHRVAAIGPRRPHACPVVARAGQTHPTPLHYGAPARLRLLAAGRRASFLGPHRPQPRVCDSYHPGQSVPKSAACLRPRPSVNGYTVISARTGRGEGRGGRDSGGEAGAVGVVGAVGVGWDPPFVAQVPSAVCAATGLVQCTCSLLPSVT